MKAHRRILMPPGSNDPARHYNFTARRRLRSSPCTGSLQDFADSLHMQVGSQTQEETNSNTLSTFHTQTNTCKHARRPRLESLIVLRLLSDSPQNAATVEDFQVTASRFSWKHNQFKLGQGWGEDAARDQRLH